MAEPQRLRLARLRLRLAQATHNFNLALAAVIAAEEDERRRRRGRRARRWWVREWIQRRPMYGHYETLMGELEREHQADFKTFIRMEPAMFHEIAQRVGPLIEKSAE